MATADQPLSIEVENRERFAKFLRDAQKSMGDLRVPFGLIARSQFKFQRQIFQLEGKKPGQYQDLSPKYKVYKTNKLGNPYPILFFSGKLAASMLNPGGDNILRITKTFMEFGTRVVSAKGAPYPRFHQFGDGNNPRRPFLFIDEQRRKAWMNIIRIHARKAITKPTGRGAASLGGLEG